MGRRFWLRRFTQVFAGTFVVIAAVQFLKTGDVYHALQHGVTWAAASATLFISARIWQSRRGQHCAICKDTPEMAAHAGSTAPTPPEQLH